MDIEPTAEEAAAMRQMFDGYQRLKALGWRDAIYAPVDRTPLHLIDAGCTSIARGERDEARRFWVYDGDIWPSHPTLFRLAAHQRMREGSEPTIGGRP